MRKSMLRNEDGFTLIEIISVLVILGILAAVAVPKYIDLQADARKKAAEAAIAEVKARLSMGYGKYLLASGKAPTKTSEICNATDSGLPKDCGTTVTGIGDFTVGLTTTDTVVTITVTQVDGVDLDDPDPVDTWTLPQ